MGMRLPDAISARHARPCPSRSGGWCDCTPRYQAQAWSPRDRKRISRTFATGGEAIRWRRDMVISLRRATIRDVRGVTFREAAEEWLAAARAGVVRNRSGDAYAPSALRGYEQSLRRRLLPAGLGWAGRGMSRGLSLHIGLNRVSPDHYAGWDGPLIGCEFDAHDMEQLAQSRGFETSKLLTSEATASAIIAAIDDAARKLNPGDIFFLSYAGHGGQVPDLNAEEGDERDETWLAYDRQLVDDELYAHWGKFQAGVRMIVMSDSCHGGAVTKARDLQYDIPGSLAPRGAAVADSRHYRAMPNEVMLATYRAHRDLYDGIQETVPGAEKAVVSATLLAFLGCQDDQLARDGISNGLFTENLLAVWNDGASTGSHTAFHKAIRSRMPDDQQPQYKPVGAKSRSFERQPPFTVG